MIKKKLQVLQIAADFLKQFIDKKIIDLNLKY